MEAPKGKQKNIVHDAILKDIGEAIGRLAFGVITIKIHKSKIVQIEVTESKRFDDVWTVEGGAGI
jgi:hypothetical protein